MTFIKCIEALQSLDEGNTTAERCWQCLQQLTQVMEQLGEYKCAFPTFTFTDIACNQKAAQSCPTLGFMVRDKCMPQLRTTPGVLPCSEPLMAS